MATPLDSHAASSSEILVDVFSLKMYFKAVLVIVMFPDDVAIVKKAFGGNNLFI